MIRLLSKYRHWLGMPVLLLATAGLTLAQHSAVASLRNLESRLPSKMTRSTEPAPSEETVLERFVAAETRVREALNQHTFKRDVVLQTIGSKGEVTGEYVRNSQFIFDDRGRRIERVLFHPGSTIREMRITKEDIQDLEGGQLLGIDIVEATKYHLSYAGSEVIEGRQLFAIDVTPLEQPDPHRMKNRFFVGRVWVDPISFQIVKIRGVIEPQGKQRFPMFMTWREPIKEALAFPTRTEADDVLHFPGRDVHYRIRVRYHDYKEFASKVAVKDVDDDDIKLDESSPETKKPAVKIQPASENKSEPLSKTNSPMGDADSPKSRKSLNTEVCTTNRNAPPIGEYHWPADAEVKVFFARNRFTPEQSAVLLDAMNGWNMASAENGSGVKFVYAGETDKRANCRHCLTIDRRDVFARDKHHYAFFHPMNQEDGRLLVSAWIDFDTGITELNALQGFMAHELGHGLGLWDCPNCKKNRSLMGSFPGLNKNNGLTMPSSCDLATMRSVYQEERQLAGNAQLVDRQPPSNQIANRQAGAAAKNSTAEKQSALTRFAHPVRSIGSPDFFSPQQVDTGSNSRSPFLYRSLLFWGRPF
jgi:hypothetical protein